MATLPPALRRKLENAVQEARDVAEAGARAALRALAVDGAEPFGHLSADQRALRNRLRARARQLGDRRDPTKGTHEIAHLVVECGYEHWHRMLFARFLAENGLLMHPDHGVAVTLEECEELAPDEGAETAWELAGRFASRMLPQIFRPDAPVLEVRLPPEHERKLEQLLSGLDPETFEASDALGWVYQFWQAKRKDEVNASGVKIGAEELPAVTQLFTEPYMVQFLLQNTLGAWWVGRHGRDSLPMEMPYLRFLDDGTPAAGTFDGWPDTAAEIKLLDPCCGSGHFLVAAFEILVRFRVVEEELSTADACDAVLRDNLHGLEIDERCTQIAAFALAFSAWTLPSARGHRPLPPLRIACSGLSPRATRQEWLSIAGRDERLRKGMESLFEMFTAGPVLGSLLAPRDVGFENGQGALGTAGIEQLVPLLERQLAREAERAPRAVEMGIVAKGILGAARILRRRYHLVCTNVPYLVIQRQGERLRAYVEEHYPDAKPDIATVFIARFGKSLEEGGAQAVVSPLNWGFLPSYKSFRKRLFGGSRLNLFARLGPGAFETISGEVVSVSLAVLSRSAPASSFVGIDALDASAASEKARALRERPPEDLPLTSGRTNPDARIILDSRRVDLPLLAQFADAYWGQGTGDSPRFYRYWWEPPRLDGSRWSPVQSTVKQTAKHGGRRYAVLWEAGHGQLKELEGRLRALDGHQGIRPTRGSEAWGNAGVAVTLMQDLPATIYTGEIFDSNCAAIVPKDADDLPAIWNFVSSPEFEREVRKIDQKKNVTNATLLKVPFDIERWSQSADDRAELLLPQSPDPREWIFHGHPAESDHPLQVAVLRLLGFHWPAETDEELRLSTTARGLVLRAQSLNEVQDDDGIVCLAPVRGESPAHVRVEQLLAGAFGPDWSPSRLAALLKQSGCRGWTLDRWLRDRFFQQHCELFQQRPFIWHIWDGLPKGGFGALVNYHKLDRKLLETLTYTYLGDWIRRQQDDVSRDEDGAGERLTAALALQDKLKAILKGEPPCDIFVRWKPIEKQPMGWDPDLDDGVRVNIRPFMLVGDVKYKGAGVLRYKPRIHWKKDRGTDPSDAPWYHLGPDYGEKKGARINDHHLTLDDKRKARAEKEGK